MALLETSERASDRRLNLLLGGAATVAVIVLVLLAIAVPKILSSASTTKEIKRSNEISGCRAGYRSQVDDAAATLQTSRVNIDVASSEALSAIAIRDVDAFRAATDKGAKARMGELRAAADLVKATDRYSTLIRESRKDPGAFLRQCRSDAP